MIGRYYHCVAEHQGHCAVLAQVKRLQWQLLNVCARVMKTKRISQKCLISFILPKLLFFVFVYFTRNIQKSKVFVYPILLNATVFACCLTSGIKSFLASSIVDQFPCLKDCHGTGYVSTLQWTHTATIKKPEYWSVFQSVYWVPLWL